MHTQIEHCRICRSTELEEILDLGEQALTGVFPRSTRQQVPIGPLQLVKCRNGCGLVQLKHTYAPEEMYGDNYGYRSGLNKSMVQHLRRRVDVAKSIAQPAAGDIILDIGSNDSTTLQAYGEHGYRLLGIDPSAKKFASYYPKHIQLLPDFFNRENFQKVFKDEKAKIVTSIAMFYDLDDPTEFMRDIRDCLSDDGIWVFEQSYLPLMIERNAYDTICHEHVSYYALKQIKWMTDRVGFKILDVELNDINGGSFCVTVAKSESSHVCSDSVVQQLLSDEQHGGYNDTAVYAEFRRRVIRHRDEFRSLLRRLNASGKRVYGYGASTKGNVVLQYCGVTREMMPGIAEVNQDKFGAYTPHNYIPIASEREIKDAGADYLVVLPWHFRENILEREAAYLASGGNLIFPLPQLEIVNSKLGSRAAA